MPSQQLDILAFEPFHGGGRKAMLDAIARCSRHRWTLLKLPPRKIERRLLIAATWFAEHLSRNQIGRFDLVFCGETLNLADLFRLRPELARRPSVVYFHDNQLPDPTRGHTETPVDLVNLNSAMAATEIWFNSLYNLRTFLGRASGLVARHPELQMRDPMPSLTAKAHLVPPPIEMTVIDQHAARPDTRSVLLDARGADPKVLSEVLAKLERRKEAMRLTVIGPIKDLPTSLSPIRLREGDDDAHTRALQSSGLLISARPHASGDDLAVRALALGVFPILLDDGVYPELLPESLHRHCLHDGTPESIVERVLDACYLERPQEWAEDREQSLAPFDAIRACKIMDKRLETLAGGGRKPKPAQNSPKPAGIA